MVRIDFSDPACPVNVSFVDSVRLPVPSPCGRLSRPLSTIHWSDPQRYSGHLILNFMPLPLLTNLSNIGSFRVRVLCRVTVFPQSGLICSSHPCAALFQIFIQWNLLGLPSSCLLLFTRATLFSDPGEPSRTSPLTVLFLYWLLQLQQHRHSLLLLTRLSQASGGRSPYGLRDSLCTLQLLRSVHIDTSSQQQHSV
jgi:hypothetical protein